MAKFHDHYYRRAALSKRSSSISPGFWKLDCGLTMAVIKGLTAHVVL